MTTPTIALKDVPDGVLCFTHERITEPGLKAGTEPEMRVTVYQRLAGDGRCKGFVKVMRIATFQGHPNGGRKRYDSGIVNCTDPGEAHGLTQVRLVDDYL